MKRRPTAEDRELADVFRKLAPGNYSLDVEDTTKAIAFLGLARLKTEGSIQIDLDSKIVFITPKQISAAA